MNLVDEGFDLGIRIGGVAADAQLVARVIAATRPYIYAAPAYLQWHGRPQDVSELNQHHRLIFGLRPTTSAWHLVGDDEAAKISIDGPSRLRFDSGEAIRKAAIHGIGIAHLPAFMVERDVIAGRLIQLFPAYGGQEIPVYAVYPNRKHLAAKTRLFIDQLVTGLRNG